MNKLLLFCLFIVTILLSNPHLSHGQTPIYNNDFSETPPYPAAPIGLIVVSGNTEFTTGSASGAQIAGSAGGTLLTPGMLATWTSVATTPMGLTNDGFAQATGDLSLYPAPFDPILSANTQLISWTFNMRTGDAPSGFSSGRDGAAVILACNDADIRTAGKGYAVIFNPLIPTGVQLVSYSGGLTGTLSPIVTSGGFMTAPTNFLSIRVVYDPFSNDWTLSFRDDGPTAFAVPTVGPLTVAGTGTDGAYTSSTMTTFGFFSNYNIGYFGAGPDAENAYFDNFAVNMICASITGTLTTCIGSTTALAHPIPGGVWSSINPSVAVVATDGVVTGVSAGPPTDTATITYSVGGSCFITAVVTVNPTPGPASITGDLTVCIGATNTLSTPTPIPTGTWSTSTTTIGTVNPTTGAFTGITAGTTTVSYTIPPGCYTTSVVTVSANPAAITGTPSVCIGTSTTLGNPDAGGTWSSSATGTATIGSASGILTGAAVGTATISYTLTASGCFSTIIASVNTTPSAITSADILRVCVGNTLSLISSPAGGTWAASSPGGALSIDASGVVTGLIAGTGTVTYTVGVCTTTAVVTVNAALPATTGTRTVCEGSNTLLSNAAGGGTWSSSSTANATVGATTGVVTGVAAGNANIIYTQSAGCNATAIVTINPLPGPITGTATVCLGLTTTLNSTPAGGTWSSSNTAVATVTAGTGVVTGNTAATATIRYTTTLGCIGTRIITVNPNPGAITGTATVCIGSATTLSSTPTGGTWSSGTGAIATVSGAGVVNGISAGTTNITYTRLGCISTRVVTVNPLPGTITGTPTVCEGLTTAFTSTPGGGAWTSSNTTIASFSGAPGILTGNAAGTANITYTIGTGCSRSRTVTVNPLPNAITGATVLCPGSSAPLASTSMGGIWSSGTPAVATIIAATGALSGVTTGTSTITYTLGTGCITTTIVTIAPAPPAILTPLGDTILCPGDFVTLTVTTSPGVTYSWFNGGVLIPGAGGPTYIASTSGSYRARINVAAGCSSTSAPMSVIVSPAVAIITVPGGTTAACTGTPVTLDANTGTGLTYQWELAGTAIAGATSSSLNALTSGSYAVRVTNPAGCWALSTPVAVTVSAVPSNIVSASGPLTICSGNNVTFTAAMGTGYTYQWYNAAGPIAGATGVSYAATTAESYYVIVTNAIGCSATSAISVVAVNPLPDVSITPGGTRVFCAGGSVLLDAAPGYTYQWYRNGVAIPGANSAIYAATLSGGYRVMVTDAGTGCSDMTHADTVVTVLGSVSSIALTPAKFCWGGSSLLSTSASSLGSAIAYQWFFNGVPIPGATAGSYSAGVSGAYHCEISVPGSCTLISTTTAVNEVPLPNPPIAFDGASLFTASHFVTYQWYKDLVVIPGAATSSTPAIGNGNYKVAVTDTNGCQSVSAVYVLTGWTGPTSVADINNPTVKIFPSPAKQAVHIESSINVTAVISSIDGKVLLNVPNATILNISNFADGIYIISLFDESGKLLTTQKLLKQQ